FTHAPEYILLTHLCRFAVRAAMGTSRTFSRCAGQRIRFGKKPPRPLAGLALSVANSSLTPTSILDLTTAGAGIFNLLSIVYALRPRLRSRLTLGGRTCPRKPWVYGGLEFHQAYRYSCLHSLLSQLHTGFRQCFCAATMLPYQRKETNSSTLWSFGIAL